MVASVLFFKDGDMCISILLFAVVRSRGDGQPLPSLRKGAGVVIQEYQERERDGHLHSYYSSLRGCGYDHLFSKWPAVFLLKFISLFHVLKKNKKKNGGGHPPIHLRENSS